MGPHSSVVSQGVSRQSGVKNLGKSTVHIRRAVRYGLPFHKTLSVITACARNWMKDSAVALRQKGSIRASTSSKGHIFRGVEVCLRRGCPPCRCLPSPYKTCSARRQRKTALCSAEHFAGHLLGSHGLTCCEAWVAAQDLIISTPLLGNAGTTSGVGRSSDFGRWLRRLLYQLAENIARDKRWNTGGSPT